MRPTRTRRLARQSGRKSDVMPQHLPVWPVSQNRHVFTSPKVVTGGPLASDAVSGKPAVLESVGEPMRFHDLRHSHVALLIEQGCTTQWSHPGWVTQACGPYSMSTDTSMKASIGTLRTPSSPPGRVSCGRGPIRRISPAVCKKTETPTDQGLLWVGATGFEPVTSAV